MRVWSWTSESASLKNEAMVLGGRVEDLDWDGEGKRILVVGGGSVTARVIMWDTGSQLGTLMKHDKTALTGAMKPVRPYAAAYGGADFASGVTFCKGPPFKYDHAVKEHTNFVNCLRYAPDGSALVSVSSDKSVLLYDGAAGTLSKTLKGHKSAVYAASWAPDSAAFVTASSDKTLKTWSAADGTCTNTITIGSTVADQQLGVAWAGADRVVSVSLKGDLNIVGTAGEADVKTITGHVAPATCLAYDASSHSIVSGDLDGRVVLWTPQDDAHTAYVGSVAGGDGHTGKVSFAVASSGKFATVAFDDTLRVGDFASGSFTSAVPLEEQARALSTSAAAPDFFLVATSKKVSVFSASAEVASVDAAWGPTCVDVAAVAGADGVLVAVGGEDKKVHFFHLDAASGALTEAGTNATELRAAVHRVAIAPDASVVAAADTVKEIKLLEASGEFKNIVSGRWTKHSTKPVALAWNSTGTVLASVAADRRMAFWSPSKKTGALEARDLAHFQPYLGMAWAGSHDAVWTVGSDGNIIRVDAPSQA